MWQIDIKGPFTIDGKRVKALVILDEYSRFLLSARLFKSITTEIVTQDIKHCIEKYSKPDSIYYPITVLSSDISSQNGALNQKEKSKWFTHHHFTLSVRVKIERCIRNFNEEYIRLDKVFEDTQTLLEEYWDWYNNERSHMGIKDCPANIYFS